MNQKEKMTKNLLEALDDFFMQLVYLKDLLSVENDMADSKEKLQCAPNFTLIVECALIDSYTLVLMKLYDKSEKAQTIPNLIKKCKKNSHLFPSPSDTLSKLNEFESKINQDEYISHAIKTLMSAICTGRRPLRHSPSGRHARSERPPNQMADLGLITTV